MNNEELKMNKLNEGGVWSVESGVVSKATTKNINSNRFIKYFTLHTPPSKLKCAFTLAEVLITLVVIGVVAAMTMPTLIAKYQEKQTVTQLKKVYSEISQAYQQLHNEYGSLDNWFTADDTSYKFLELFSTKMKFIKTCQPQETGCWTDEFYNTREDTTPLNSLYSYYSSAILSDGTMLAFAPYDSTSQAAQIIVDINGNRGQNRFSIDMFTFLLLKDKVIPRGVQTEQVLNNGTDSNDINDFDIYCKHMGHSCTAWVIYNSNMDYLHCPDELSWDGKTKCD